MRSLKLIAALCLLILMGFTSRNDPPGFKISMFDELAPLYPDTKIEKQVTSYSVDVCLGSIAGVDILLTDMVPGEAIRFTLSSKGILDQFYANWYFMIDVPVTENTGLDSRTEKFSGQTNPYVIRKAPFRIYEALDPVQSGYIPGRTTQALRMEIPVGKNFPTGKKTDQQTISGV